MSLTTNPFTVGQPVSPDRFIGRTRELATAFDQMIVQGNLALWGNPGIGKTSFLEKLASPEAWVINGCDRSKAVIILFSCLSLQPFNPKDFWREMFVQIKEALPQEPSLQAEVQVMLDKNQCDPDFLRSILRSLGKHHKFLVLLIDDYDAALRPQDDYNEDAIASFLGDCRNLANCSERKYLSMIVTSHRRLNEIGPKLNQNSSPWYNHYLFLPLKSFDDAEVSALLGSMPMTPALRDGLHEIADGNPALLQTAGHLLYRELRSGKVPSPESYARDFQSAASHFFEDTWFLANDIEQTLMMLIALKQLQGRSPQRKQYDLGDINIIFSQKERELTDLEERGIIIQRLEEGKKSYAFASSMMEWWVVKELENSTEEWLQDRQKVFLNLMSHKQSETVIKAIHWLWEHKDQVPSLIEWIARVAGALPKGLI
jgi:hypothetical protein